MEEVKGKVDEKAKEGKALFSSLKKSLEAEGPEGVEENLPSTSWRKYECDLSSEDVVMTADGVKFVRYKTENQLTEIMKLIERDLSEPYSIFTYRYFIHNWPQLCFLAMDGDKCIGCVVCKLDLHKAAMRGYIAMLAVDKEYRGRSIGTSLVVLALKHMEMDGADEAVLETEITNTGAMRLYERLGFVRDKRLHRYYLNGIDAFRLKLWFTAGPE